MDELRKGIAIGMLFGSEGRTATNLIESKTIKENGTYSAIYEIDPETGEVYDPPKDGYETVVVSLPIYNKRVALTTSDVTDSQTAIFEYDPQDETPNPWEGYLYFTIDLSGVKRDINDLLDQISALEDQLEEMQACCEDVAEILDATPEEGESCCDAVKSKAQEAVDHIEECDQCKADVIAKLQEYDPDFDPQTCEDIVDKIDEIEEEAEKPDQYTFEQDPTSPTYPDPDWYDKIAELVADDPLTDDDMNLRVEYYEEIQAGGSRKLITYRYIDTTTGSIVGTSRSWQVRYPEEHPSSLHGFKMLDYTTGKYEFYYKYWSYHYPGWWYEDVRYEETDSRLIGYGDPTHSYTVSKNS